MDNCFLIVNKIAKNKAKDHISLSYDERFLRRKKLVSDNGFEFLVNLPETKSLSENQAFRLESGNLILIKNFKQSCKSYCKEKTIRSYKFDWNRKLRSYFRKG